MKVSIKKTELYACMFGGVSFISCFSNAYISLYFSRYSQMIFFLRLILIAFFGVFLFLKKRRISTATIYSIAIAGTIIISTLINKGDVVGSLWTTTPFVVIVMCLEFVSSSETKLLRILLTWKNLLLFVVMIDLITEILYPNGLYRDRLYTNNWFLGYKTARVVYILALIYIYVYLLDECKKKQTVSLFIVTCICLLDSWLSGATAASVSLLILMVLFYIIINLYRNRFRQLKPFIKALLDYRLIMLLYVLLVISIVFINDKNIMEWVASVTGKDATFTSRTSIWMLSIAELRGSLLIGRGYWDSLAYEAMTQHLGVYGGTNAHDAILTILMSSGLIGLLLYGKLYIHSFEKWSEIQECELLLACIIYTSWLLGVSSSTIVFSTFSMMMYWILVHKRAKSQYFEIRR